MALLPGKGLELFKQPSYIYLKRNKKKKRKRADGARYIPVNPGGHKHW